MAQRPRLDGYGKASALSSAREEVSNLWIVRGQEVHGVLLDVRPQTFVCEIQSSRDDLCYLALQGCVE